MDENTNKIDLIKTIDRFFKTLMRYKKVALVVILSMAILFPLKSFLTYSPTYSSYVVFMPSKGGNISYSTSDESDDMFNAFNSLLTGSKMREVVMQDLGKNYLSGVVSTQRISNTNLVELVVCASDPKEAYDMANSIVNNYTLVTKNTMSDIQMVVFDEAELATKADAYPNYVGQVVKGAFVGCGIIFVYLLIVSIFRHTICYSSDVKKLLNLTTLAKIPFVPSINPHSLLLTNPSVQPSFVAAIQELRMKLEQDHRKNNHQVYMMTSTLPNEGKSTVSFNTAISLSQKGNKVLLVDMDLRNPSLIKMSRDHDDRLGAGHYLEGSALFDEIITPYSDKLDVIFGSTSFQNAPELLSSLRLKEFIRIARKKYDYVLFDVPPLYMMEDAILIAEYCDSALLVVKQDFAMVDDMMEALEELNNQIDSICGVIINQIKPSIFDHEESAILGYGYGYGYGRKES
ncbi:MAG: polysaccharide biosynthesis tyrosine autokinase [Traorella sp.]